MKVLFFVLSSLFLVSCATTGVKQGKTLTYKPNATVSIIGTIMTQSLAEVDRPNRHIDLPLPQISNQQRIPTHTDTVLVAKHITTLAATKNVKHFTFLIDSPGGRIDAGMTLVNTMKHLKGYGVKFTCVVTGKAMSMALAIFTECDNRYATFGSAIMWHSAAIMGFVRLNQQSSLALSQDLEETNKWLWEDTRDYFTDDFFKIHFDQESIINVSDIETVAPDYLEVVFGVKPKGK